MRAERIGALLIAGIVAGCAVSGQRDALFWAKVGGTPEGMSREEVTARLGEPNRIETAEGRETLWYDDNLSHRSQRGRNYYVVFLGGKVVEHGARASWGYDGDRIAGIEIGMKKDEVLRRLGKPDTGMKEGVREVLIYQEYRTYRRYGIHRPFDPVDYHVVFEDGTLVKKGDVYRVNPEPPLELIFRTPPEGTAK
jgi:outer membrane protein assembly factor BamE (lipoprotein component of BamABCDE complex)